MEKITDQFIDIPAATIRIREEGFLHIHIKIEDEFTIEHSASIVKARTELADGRKMPILYTATKFVIPSKEVREYVASESRSELVVADAFVINSLPQRMMVRFFLKFNKPVRPTQFFDEETSAVRWLKQFV